MTEDEIEARLRAELPAWRHADGTIRRTYRTGSWPATLVVVTTIGHLAQAAWHHPDLVVGYDRVEVRLSTHDAKAVTAKDFALAAKIESVVLWQPGREGGALAGPPAGETYLRPED